MSIAEKLTTIAENEPKVYEAGRTDEWSGFWDALQIKGERTQYQSLFEGQYWDDITFKPKYDIIPVNTNAMFYNSKITDLVSILEKQGVTLDFSKCSNVSYLFQFSANRRVGTIDLTSNTRNECVIGENYNITDIKKFVLKDDGSQPKSTSWFWGMFALKNVTIEGKIGQSCHFSQSYQLTYESLLSIIGALYDYSGTSETRTLTLHAAAKARLTEADIAIATQKGWTIA